MLLTTQKRTMVKKKNLKLDQQAYTPFAYIIWGMNAVDQIYKHTADEALAISSG